MGRLLRAACMIFVQAVPLSCAVAFSCFAVCMYVHPGPNTMLPVNDQSPQIRTGSYYK